VPSNHAPIQLADGIVATARRLIMMRSEEQRPRWEEAVRRLCNEFWLLFFWLSARAQRTRTLPLFVCKGRAGALYFAKFLLVVTRQSGGQSSAASPAFMTLGNQIAE